MHHYTSKGGAKEHNIGNYMNALYNNNNFPPSGCKKYHIYSMWHFLSVFILHPVGAEHCRLHSGIRHDYESYIEAGVL